jgi:hypothetical protein
VTGEAGADWALASAIGITAINASTAMKQARMVRVIASTVLASRRALVHPR